MIPSLVEAAIKMMKAALEADYDYLSPESFHSIEIELSDEKGKVSLERWADDLWHAVIWETTRRYPRSIRSGVDRLPGRALAVLEESLKKYPLQNIEREEDHAQ